jgi:hypothetical protein
MGPPGVRPYRIHMRNHRLAIATCLIAAAGVAIFLSAVGGFKGNADIERYGFISRDELHLDGTGVPDAVVCRALRDNPELGLIDVSQNPDVTLSCLQGIEQRKRPLRVFRANRTRVGDAIVPFLNSTDQLTRLFLAETEITDAGVESLTIQTLETIDFSGTQVSAKAVSHVIRRAKRLNTLYIARSCSDQDAITTWGACDSLGVLDWSGVELRPSTARAIAGMKRLNELALCDSMISDEVAEALSTSASIEVLNLDGCDFQTPNGVAALFKTPSLRVLIVERASIASGESLRAVIPVSKIDVRY